MFLKLCDSKNESFEDGVLQTGVAEEKQFLNMKLASINNDDQPTLLYNIEIPTVIENITDQSNDLINIAEAQIFTIQYENFTGLLNEEIITEHCDTIQTHISNINNNINIINLEYNKADSLEACENSNTGHSDDIPDDITESAIDDLSHDEQTDQSETDLTSLNWLHKITNIMSVADLTSSPNPSALKTKKKASNREDLTINIDYYKENGDKKPPFSYASLICMAMGKNGNKMTLSAIYQWIKENFLYYKTAHPSWQVGRC